MTRRRSTLCSRSLTALLAAAAALAFCAGPAGAQNLGFAPPPPPAEVEAQTDDFETTDDPDGHVTVGPEYVSVPDLASQLRQIDTSAVVEWDGRVLRIVVGGQRFSLFLREARLVANGKIEDAARPLRVLDGEIYVAREVVEQIGARLEAALAEATPTPAPNDEETTEPSPETSPEPTPSPVRITDAAPTPAAAPTPRLQAAAEPAPQPRRTPIPSANDQAAREAERSGREPDIWKRALAERAVLDQYQFTERPLSGLLVLAGDTRIERIVIDPDDLPIAGTKDLSERAATISIEIAHKLKMRLERDGYDVVLTRTGARRASLAERIETIVNSNAQVLLCLRAGVSDWAEAQGPRIQYFDETLDFSLGRRRIREAAERVPLEMNYMPFQPRTRLLVSALSRTLTETAAPRAAAARGETLPEPSPTERVPDYLHRRAPMASATVILGYLSNPEDAQALTRDEGQERIAGRIADGLSDFNKLLGERAFETTTLASGGGSQP